MRLEAQGNEFLAYLTALRSPLVGLPRAHILPKVGKRHIKGIVLRRLPLSGNNTPSSIGIDNYTIVSLHRSVCFTAASGNICIPYHCKLYSDQLQS